MVIAGFLKPAGGVLYGFPGHSGGVPGGFPGVVFGLLGVFMGFWVGFLVVFLGSMVFFVCVPGVVWGSWGYMGLVWLFASGSMFPKGFGVGAIYLSMSGHFAV